MKLAYPVCIYQNENGYTVTAPDLPGCVSEGETIEEAFEMIVDAASGWVLDELEEGRTPPKSSNILDIKPDEYPGGVVSVAVLDIDAYAELYGSKAIRKNCTLPLWLNKQAEAAHNNFSAVLQEALINKLGIQK